MKELILVRHAKSDWGNEFLKDIDRALSERGYSDAYFLSEWFSKNREHPELIVSSPATRALSTALIFQRAMDLPLTAVVVSEHIYESTPDEILKVIRGLDRKTERVLITGHNPGFTDLCNQLTGDIFFENIPTCGIVSFLFDVKKWQDVEFKKGKLNYYQFPKDFKNIT
jgi:phosphohistidine phosphatase